MDKIRVKTKFLSTDIISAKFWSSYVLAGVGGLLRIYDVASAQLHDENEVFESHQIHGITIGRKNHIIVFGAKDVFILELQSTLSSGVSSKICASLSMEDWILSAEWIEEEKQVALVTAHNVAWLWTWGRSNKLLKHATCVEKCILYSALIQGVCWEDSVVFAGTVFREVLIWLPCSITGGDQPVLHRLTGHHGVIFSITWDCDTRRLCTTSDDRSARVWQVEQPGKNKWVESTVTASHTFYGHTARVWQSLMLQDMLVTIGEDSQVCVWNNEGKMLKSWRACAGDCVWSIDYSSKHQLLVTGGGDGSLHFWPLSLPLQTPAAAQMCHPNICLSSSPQIRKVALLKSGNAIVILDDGSLVCSLDENMTAWSLIFTDTRFANYCILSLSQCRTRFALASLHGHVSLFSVNELSQINQDLEQKLEHGKIWSVHWLSLRELLVCGDEGRLSIWILQENGGLKCSALLSLPSSRERWTTAAAQVMRESVSYLVCGDRCGSLHLYQITPFSNKERVNPDHSLVRLHGHLGVTSLNVDGTMLISTGRDGTLRHLCIENVCTKGNLAMRLCPLSADRMMMDWVCGVLLRVPPGLKGPLVIGFKETHMLVWSVGERRALLELFCGGGHRSWDCLLLEESRLQIAFIREKHVWSGVWEVNNLLRPALLPGLHAHEVNCTRILPGIPHVLATAGEDGTIIFAQFSKISSDNLGELYRTEHRLVFNSHISSVRCLAVSKNILFSAGGRAQLKAWRLERATDDKFTCWELASHMLKGGRSQSTIPDIDPEMRYMSVCCVARDNSEDSMLLASACSDGALRFLTFNLTNNIIQVVGDSFFHGQCLLCVLSLKINGRGIVISSATDGQVAMWDMSNSEVNISATPQEPFWFSKMHQSGVNSVYARKVTEGDPSILMLATGGDDNTLTLNALQFSKKDVKYVARWHSSSAHAAQITGVWIIEDFLISSSVDQRITIWRWKLDPSDPVYLECVCLRQFMSSIPDMKDLQVWKESDSIFVCVVGKGVQVYDIVSKTVSNKL